MKNVRCKKIETVKDISLFGSFKFPCNGPDAGGNVTQSLAGQGKCVSKTKAQVQALSMRTMPLARTTGAIVTEALFQTPDQTVDVNTNSQRSDSSSAQFIQLSSATPEELDLVPGNEASVNDDLRPASRFALEKGTFA